MTGEATDRRLPDSSEREALQRVEGDRPERPLPQASAVSLPKYSDTAKSECHTPSPKMPPTVIRKVVPKDAQVLMQGTLDWQMGLWTARWQSRCHQGPCKREAGGQRRGGGGRNGGLKEGAGSRGMRVPRQAGRGSAPAPRSLREEHAGRRTSPDLRPGQRTNLLLSATSWR